MYIHEQDEQIATEGVGDGMGRCAECSSEVQPQVQHPDQDDDDGLKSPESTLRYYQGKGLLHATRISRTLKYTRVEGLRFLEKLTENTKGNLF